MNKKINIILPIDLLEKVDNKAKSLYMTRTAYIIHSLINTLNSDEIIQSLPELKKVINLMQQDEENNNICFKK